MAKYQKNAYLNKTEKTSGITNQTPSVHAQLKENHFDNNKSFSN